jgi:hypothetical protein
LKISDFNEKTDFPEKSVFREKRKDPESDAFVFLGFWRYFFLPLLASGQNLNKKVYSLQHFLNILTG